MTLPFDIYLFSIKYVAYSNYNQSDHDIMYIEMHVSCSDSCSTMIFSEMYLSNNRIDTYVLTDDPSNFKIYNHAV
jgi:hypothetical protein